MRQGRACVYGSKSLRRSLHHHCTITAPSLVFEATGGMSEETQKWWESVLALERDRREPGDPTSLRELGLEHTFSANKFSTMWLQKISMGYARAQAESVLCLIGKNSNSNGAGSGCMQAHGAGESVD